MVRMYDCTVLLLRLSGSTRVCALRACLGLTCGTTCGTTVDIHHRGLHVNVARTLLFWGHACGEGMLLHPRHRGMHCAAYCCAAHCCARANDRANDAQQHKLRKGGVASVLRSHDGSAIVLLSHVLYAGALQGTYKKHST